MSRKHLIFAGALAAVLAIAASACACLWDSDTLQMERLRFPGVLEIITGKFVRHSQAYYEWRIKDRLKKLETSPDDPALIDDLAVGYDKLGRYGDGIAVLERSLAANPDRYETLANLATLLFHAGRLEESKQHVRRALEINPDAHFGREKYQLLLMEYVLQSELKNSGVLSTEDRNFGVDGPPGFASFVLKWSFPDSDLPSHFGNDGKLLPTRVDELKRAGKGVLGMMHFADYQSPILLEALGDLLMTGEMEENGTQLAARAYLRAAQFSRNPNAAEQFQNMAEQAVANHIDFDQNGRNWTLSDLELQLSNEVAAADGWFAKIQAHEARWIAEGRNVDRDFAVVYYDSLDATISDAERQLESEPKEVRLSQRQRHNRVIFKAGLICIGLPVAIVLVSAIATVLWLRRRRIQTETPGKPVTTVITP